MVKGTREHRGVKLHYRDGSRLEIVFSDDQSEPAVVTKYGPDGKAITGPPSNWNREPDWAKEKKL